MSKNNPKKRQALVMCLADPSGNPRPRRVIEFLSESGFHVTVFSFKIEGNIEFDKAFIIPKPSASIIAKLIRFWLKIFWLIVPNNLLIQNRKAFFFGYKKYFKTLLKEKKDLILVEDLDLLPLSIQFKYQNRSKVLFDAREFYTKQFEDSVIFRLLHSKVRTKICQTFLPICDSIITVSPGLAKEYTDVFKVQTQIIRSVPNYISMIVNQVNSTQIKMVHHGAANRNRKLENMIKLFDHLDDRFALDFYLTDNDYRYKAELINLASQYSKIKILSPVSFLEIIPTLNRYDIGLSFLAPSTFNLKYSLPNKLFEFIQARIMVAVGPSPDMANLVRQYQCGIISDSFKPQSLATYLNNLRTEDIMYFKSRSDQAAKILCFEAESKKLQKIIKTCMEENDY